MIREDEAGHKTRPYEIGTVDGGEAGYETRPAPRERAVSPPHEQPMVGRPPR